MNTDQNYIYIVIIAFKNYNRKLPKNGNILQKTVNKNIFTNFEILLLSHNFPICHKLLIYGIALINFTTDVTGQSRIIHLSKYVTRTVTEYVTGVVMFFYYFNLKY